MLEKRNLKDSSEMLAIYLGAELIGYVNFLTSLSFQLCKSNMRYFCNWKTSYFLKRKFKNFNATALCDSDVGMRIPNKPLETTAIMITPTR